MRRDHKTGEHAAQDSDRPGAVIFKIEVSLPVLLDRRRNRRGYDQRHRRADRHVHHRLVFHAEQRQQINEDRNPHDAAADTEQSRHKTRHQPQRQQHTNFSRKIHGSAKGLRHETINT